MTRLVLCCLLAVSLFIMVGCANQASPSQTTTQINDINTTVPEQPVYIDPELIISASEMESVLGYPTNKTTIPNTTTAQYESVDDEKKTIQIQINLVPVAHRPFSPVDYYKKFKGFKEVDIGDEACFILVNKLEIQRGDYTISIQLYKDAPESVGIELGRTICNKLDNYLAK